MRRHRKLANISKLSAGEANDGALYDSPGNRADDPRRNNNISSETATSSGAGMRSAGGAAIIIEEEAPAWRETAVLLTAESVAAEIK